MKYADAWKDLKDKLEDDRDHAEFTANMRVCRYIEDLLEEIYELEVEYE